MTLLGSGHVQGTSNDRVRDKFVADADDLHGEPQPTQPPTGTGRRPPRPCPALNKLCTTPQPGGVYPPEPDRLSAYPDVRTISSRQGGSETRTSLINHACNPPWNPQIGPVTPTPNPSAPYSVVQRSIPILVVWGRAIWRVVAHQCSKHCRRWHETGTVLSFRSADRWDNVLENGGYCHSVNGGLLLGLREPELGGISNSLCGIRDGFKPRSSRIPSPSVSLNLVTTGVSINPHAVASQGIDGNNLPKRSNT